MVNSCIEFLTSMSIFFISKKCFLMLPDHFYCRTPSKFLLFSLSMLNIVFYSSCLNYLIFEAFLFFLAACVLAASQLSYVVYLCCIVLLTVTSSIYLELYM